MLKPFRDYDEHEVVNLFATQEGVLDRGTFVQFVHFDPDAHNAFGAIMPGLPTIAYTYDYVVNARVQAASGVTNTSGVVTGAATGVLGLTLFDVRVNLPYLNMPANLADPVRLAEQNVVPSGRAVPILKRGIVEINSFSGSPFPGLKAVVGPTGSLIVTGQTVTPAVGTWLSQSGADGYALLQVHCL